MVTASPLCPRGLFASLSKPTMQRCGGHQSARLAASDQLGIGLPVAPHGQELGQAWTCWGTENLGWGALFFNPSFGYADHLVVTTGDTAS